MLKSFPKILTIFFLLIFIFQLACLLFLTLVPSVSQAADIKFTPQVGIPVQKQADDTFDFSGKTENIFPKDGSTKPIAEYIRVIYKYAIGIIGILAAVVLMVGGVLWIVAGGNATQIGEAKAWIGASLTGLVLALMSYLILATVNPALVDLKTTAVKKVAPTIQTNFDASTPCGQQISGQNIICGSKCPAGQKCEKVSGGTVGARKCPETLTNSEPSAGSGDYYLCSNLSGGGTSCCDGNNDAQCLSGYVCNMFITSGDCIGRGVCAVKQNLNGMCGENNDCVNNNCNAGTFGTHRCQ